LNNLTINIINPLTEPHVNFKRESVLDEFSPDFDSIHNCPVSLYKYISNEPEKFYCKRTFLAQSKFLNDQNNIDQILVFLDSNNSKFDHALKSLDEVNKKSWHDSSVTSDEYDFFRFCESEVNPAYLTLTEGVYGVLIHMNAFISRIHRGKSTDGLDIYNRVEEIKKTYLEFISECYCNTTRNSIAHGDVKYTHRDIEFKDKNSIVKNSPWAYINRFDILLDICNGLAIAYKKFFFCNISTMKIPKQVFLEELYEQTKAPWWKIEGCLDSEAISDKSQLVIFVSPTTRDFNKINASSIWTAILAESYAPGYDRYFLSLRAPFAHSGFAAFDGNILLDRRKNQVSDYEGYAGVLENNVVFWIPFITIPHIFYRLQNYYLAFNLHRIMNDLTNTRKEGISISVRNAKIHRNGWRVVLDADIVFESNSKISSSYVKKNGPKLISISINEARKRCKWYSIIKYLPLGFARISLMEGDYRSRVLKGFGLRKELIGTLQVQTISRIRTPDIYGATIEYDGKIKYAWNKAWIEEYDC